MAPIPKPAWILKTPRIVLVIVFPIVSLILYLVLSLGCISDSISGVSPIVARSNGPVNVGGQAIQVDIRVGFWGLCFGPAPFNCTGSVAVLQNKRESQLAREIPVGKGGGNFALAGLALSLQSSFVVLSGIPLLLLLVASVGANAVQVYFGARGRQRERHAQAALWARGLDWAAAAGAATSFAAYQSIAAAASRLLRTVAGVPLAVSAGATASNLFAAVVAMTVAGALINTALTAMDAGFDAYLAAKRAGAGPAAAAAAMAQEGRIDPGRGIYQKRAAYEAFL